MNWGRRWQNGGERKDNSLGPWIVCSGWDVTAYKPVECAASIHSYRSEHLPFTNPLPYCKEKGHDDLSWEGERAPLCPVKVVHRPAS